VFASFWRGVLYRDYESGSAVMRRSREPPAESGLDRPSRPTARRGCVK
jgi:hypothetical protein